MDEEDIIIEQAHFVKRMNEADSEEERLEIAEEYKEWKKLNGVD